jgi:hypothetical protein
MLRVKVIKLSKNVEQESTSSTKKVEEKCHRLPNGIMKKTLRVMQKYLKEGIMVSESPRGRIPFQEYHLISDKKEDSTMIGIIQA